MWTREMWSTKIVCIYKIVYPKLKNGILRQNGDSWKFDMFVWLINNAVSNSSSLSGMDNQIYLCKISMELQW